MATIEETLKQYYSGQAPATTTAAEPVRAPGEFRKGDVVRGKESGEEYVVREVVYCPLGRVELRVEGGGFVYPYQVTLVASHEGEPAVPEWLREQLKALPVGATWTYDGRGPHRGDIVITLVCGCESTEWTVEKSARESDASRYACTVKHCAAMLQGDCKHHPDYRAPTIVDGAAVLPVPETPPPLFPSNCLKPRPVCIVCGTSHPSRGQYCIDCAPDLSLTNEIGLPTLPPPTVVADTAPHKFDLWGADRPQPGDVVSWEAYVGESDGKPVMAKHEGLVVKKAPAGPSWCLHARRKVDGKTVVTVVAVERCTVVRKRGSL